MASFLPNVNFRGGMMNMKKKVGEKIKEQRQKMKGEDTMGREWQEKSLRGMSLRDGEKYYPPIRWCKVVKVYDGDTITVLTMIEGVAYKFSVRLRGIDTPEIRGSSVKEKAKAIEARDYLKTMIFEKMVELRNMEYDKYGRILSDVFLGGNGGEGSEAIGLSNLLIEKKYAVAYDGGKKSHDWSK